MPQLLDPSMTLAREGDRITLRRSTWPAGYPLFQLHPVCAVILALQPARALANICSIGSMALALALSFGGVIK